MLLPMLRHYCHHRGPEAFLFSYSRSFSSSTSKPQPEEPESSCSKPSVSKSSTLKSSSSSPKPRSNHLITSHQVRNSFIDFFVHQNGHQFYRSSPVKPSIHDQSLLFVNAGMNQFKPIFLDQLGSGAFDHFVPLKRVANSQKCIRVGGKHCDLENVGADFTHHTFFEMLGNWSFDDYFKKEACQMAWTLLTQVYHLDPSRLFITIFGGDDRLGLGTDLESYEIWRQIGVPPERIIPLGMKDNFWEMGETGPCGICTEIHYQLLNTELDPKDRDFKKKLMDSSIEIWNVVFIQYFRDSSGTLNRLDKNFVDTGMGLERILSLVQGVSNNYATDLFTPYFERLTRLTNWPEYSHQLSDPKDVAYRILADHSRMASVSIADHVTPDDRGAGYLLRRVLRRTLDSLKTLSDLHGQLPDGVTESKVLTALAQETIESLGEAFPELRENSAKIFDTIDEEVRLYSSALTRNVHLMKLADNLHLKLTENGRKNEEEISLKLDEILVKVEKLSVNLNQLFDNLDQLSGNLNSERKKFSDKPKINQAEVEQLRRELTQLDQLSTTDRSLSTRFGLSTPEIEQRMRNLDLALTEAESRMDKVLEQVISGFEAYAKPLVRNYRLSNELSGNYSIISITNDIPGQQVRTTDFFLLKIAADLFGSEGPLAVVMIQEPDGDGGDTERSILVQLTVPTELQSKIEAQNWFAHAQSKLEKQENSIKSFPMKNKRPKRMVRYRIRIADNNQKMIENICEKFCKELETVAKKALE